MQPPVGRVAFVFDHGYPVTVGGAERYYWALARAAARKRPVTYITAEPGGAAEWDEVEVVGVASRAFARGGLMLPKAAFAAGVLWHLLRRGRRYAVVHCCCFPHVAVIAARLGLLPHRGTRLVVDWHEWIPRSTWLRRRGRLGELGYALQAVATRAGDGAVTFSRLHQARLRRVRPDAVLWPEFVPEPGLPVELTAPRRKRIVFAGRLVDEKRAQLVPAVLRELRRREDSWEAVIFGEGPSMESVRTSAEHEGVADAVELMGFADWRELSRALSTSRALVFPSAREGFGLVVLEAAAHGLPSVLVAGADNAATELIEPGRNGIVCPSPDPAELARAVLRLAEDAEVHDRTRAWFEEATERFCVGAALRGMDELHAGLRLRQTDG